MPEILSAHDRAEARRKFEACKMTQDGPIWPVRRSEMRHPATVAARMREDLAALGAGAGLSAAVFYLAGLGWPEHLIDCEGASVIDALRAP